MPKTFSQEERNLAMEWSADGLSYSEIAKRLAIDFPENWKDLKSPDRAVGRLLKQARDQQAAGAAPTSAATAILTSNKTLDEMTREERHTFIAAKLQSTARFRLTFRSFGQDEKDLFIDEYLSVIRSTDTITEAEEQSLFAAVLEMVLALQALNRKEQQEKWHEQTKNGEFQEDDTRYTPHLGAAEKYAREYDLHMKGREKGLEQLKMSRRDRLKDVRTERKTLVDLAEELSSKNARSEAAEDIERLSKLRDEELKDMIANGYILGNFDE